MCSTAAHPVYQKEHEQTQFPVTVHVLFKTEALTEVNEKASIALALVLWKNHDARDVVFLLTVLLLEKGKRHRRILPLENIMENDIAEQVCAGAWQGVDDAASAR